MTRLAIVVVDRRADEDDAVLEQPREDVVGALAAVGLFDDHRDELGAGVGHGTSIVQIGLSGIEIGRTSSRQPGDDVAPFREPGHRLLAPDAGADAIERAFLLEPRPHGRRRPAGALGELLDFARRRPRRSPRSTRAARSRRARACSGPCRPTARAAARGTPASRCSAFIGSMPCSISRRTNSSSRRSISCSTSTSGAALSRPPSSAAARAARWCSASCSAPCCRSSRTRSRSASSVSSVAHFLRELVVERQQLLAPDALDRRRRSRPSRRPAPAPRSRAGSSP